MGGGGRRRRYFFVLFYVHVPDCCCCLKRFDYRNPSLHVLACFGVLSVVVIGRSVTSIFISSLPGGDVYMMSIGFLALWLASKAIKESVVVVWRYGVFGLKHYIAMREFSKVCLRLSV